jgi:hypothetical protein
MGVLLAKGAAAAAAAALKERDPSDDDHDAHYHHSAAAAAPPPSPSTRQSVTLKPDQNVLFPPDPQSDRQNRRDLVRRRR